MGKFSTFRDDLLLALAEEAEKDPDQTLSPGEIADDAGLEYRDGWEARAVESMVAKGLVRVLGNTYGAGMYVEVTGPGIEEAERLQEARASTTQKTVGGAKEVTGGQGGTRGILVDNDLPDTLLERAELLQNMLLSRATTSKGDDAVYKRLRSEFMDNPETRERLPSFVRTCRDLGQFWSFISSTKSWDPRRKIIYDAFRPLLDYLEEAERKAAGAARPPTVAAPASDRTVPLDHNSQGYKDAVKATDDVIEAVRGSNDFKAKDPEGHEQRLAELEGGRRLLTAARVRAAALAVLLIAALKWLLDAFGAGVIGKLAEVALAKLAPLLPFAL